MSADSSAPGRPSGPGRRAADRPGARHAGLAARTTSPGWPSSNGLLLDQFRRAGYEPMRTPILEFTELHERKSGAGIVAKLFELPGGGTAEICLRPELTASIVRAYTEAAECPPLPWRVSMSGPVFRFETPDARTRPRVHPGRRRAARRRRGRPPTPRSSGWPTGRCERWGSPTRRSGSATSG